MKKPVFIIAKRNDLVSVIKEALIEKDKNSPVNLLTNRLTLTQAAKSAGISIPTFLKFEKKGVFKRYGVGKKIFFIESEILEGLTKIKR